MSNELLYEVKDLCKSYSNGSKSVDVLKGVNLRVGHAETVAIMGPSGVERSQSGSNTKSTYWFRFSVLSTPA